MKDDTLRTLKGGGLLESTFRVPKLPLMGPNFLSEMVDLAKANMASEFYERLLLWMEDFDQSLNQDEEVGVRLVSFGQSVTFHVTGLGYHEPSLVVFHGLSEEGQKVTLVQHVSQISFLLIAMKRLNPDEPKRPFGFRPPAEQPAGGGVS